jgi:hypothetical protein
LFQNNRSWTATTTHTDSTRRNLRLLPDTTRWRSAPLTASSRGVRRRCTSRQAPRITPAQLLRRVSVMAVHLSRSARHSGTAGARNQALVTCRLRVNLSLASTIRRSWCDIRPVYTPTPAKVGDRSSGAISAASRHRNCRALSGPKTSLRSIIMRPASVRATKYSRRGTHNPECVSSVRVARLLCHL